MVAWCVVVGRPVTRRIDNIGYFDRDAEFAELLVCRWGSREVEAKGVQFIDGNDG